VSDIRCKIKGCGEMMLLNPQSVNNHYRHKHPKMKAEQKTRIMISIFGDQSGLKSLQNRIKNVI